MKPIRIAGLILSWLLAGCAGLNGQEAAAPDDPQRLRAALGKAEDEKLQLQQRLAELQRRSEEERQKLQSQLTERQKQLRDEQRKVEELEAKLAELEKKVAALRRIDREALQRAIRR